MPNKMIEYKYCPPPSDEIQGSKIGKMFVRLFRFVGYNPIKRRCTIFPFNKIEFFISRLWFSGLTEVIFHEEYLAKYQQAEGVNDEQIHRS